MFYRCITVLCNKKYKVFAWWLVQSLTFYNMAVHYNKLSFLLQIDNLAFLVHCVLFLGETSHEKLNKD